MKSKIITKALLIAALVLTSSVANAAITRYENSNSNDYVYGSFEIDDATNILQNVNLKLNFSEFQGLNNIDVVFDNLGGPEDAVASGSGSYSDSISSDPYYTFTGSVAIIKAIPGLVELYLFGLWETFPSQMYSNFIYFIEPKDGVGILTYFAPQAVSSVPEPDALGMFLIALVLIGFFQRRKASFFKSIFLLTR